MASSSPLPEEVYGGGGGEQQHGMYHVPQHCRREKLRYPPHDLPPATSLLLHDSTAVTIETSPSAGFPNLTTSLPFSSSSSSYFLQNPSYSLHPSSQFGGLHSLPLAPATYEPHNDRHQSSHHREFSLSLCSSSSATPSQYGRGSSFGPFTGYAAILGGSRYLEPARQLLQETGGMARGGAALFCTDLPASSAEDVSGCVGIVDGVGVSGTEHQWRKTRLISMLDEVCRRYTQYYQQIQAVITAFESVAGLSIAAPYVSMALQNMSTHFNCLRNAISDQLHQISKVLGKETKEDIPGSILTGDGVCNQRGINPVWRPQRGLPERAVSVLRAWLFDHFLHPYPSDTDKQMLAKQTGLSRNQVSNWFINARVRLWKPMVEEIHSLEVRQTRKASAKPNHIMGRQGQVSTPPCAETPSSCKSAENINIWMNHNMQPSKAFQDDISKVSSDIEEPLKYFPNGHMSSNHQAETAMLLSGDVSLSLGLHQNSGFSLTNRLVPNVACHFGVDDCNDAYVMGALEAQDRQYGRGFAGHFVHDFVG